MNVCFPQKESGNIINRGNVSLCNRKIEEHLNKVLTITIIL